MYLIELILKLADVPLALFDSQFWAFWKAVKKWKVFDYCWDLQ